MSTLEVVTEPTSEPLTLGEVRIHLLQGADGDSPAAVSPNLYEALPDDSWIIAKISAARESAEQFLGYPLTDAVYRMTLQDFSGRTVPISLWQSFRLTPAYSAPAGLPVPSWVTDVQSIEYYDADNVLQTVAPSTYYFDPATRLLYPDGDWPGLSSMRQLPIRILVKGKYSRDSSPPVLVPEAIKQAMLLMIGEWYENRQLSIGGRLAEIPIGIEWLLRPYRTRLGMA